MRYLQLLMMALLIGAHFTGGMYTERTPDAPANHEVTMPVSSTAQESVPDKIHIEREQRQDDRANTLNNLHSFGQIAENEEIILFSNPSEDNALYAFDRSSMTIKCLQDSYVNDINVTDEWIYFVNHSEGRHIQRMSQVDGNIETIIDRNCSYFSIVNDQMYFVDINEGQAVYRADLDGNNVERISDHEAEFLNVVGDWVYYTNWAGTGRLWRTKIDGSEEQVVSEFKHADAPLVHGHKIYFASGELHRLDTRTNKIDKLTEESVGFLW